MHIASAQTYPELFIGAAIIAREDRPCADRPPYAPGLPGRNSGPDTSESFFRCPLAGRVYRPMPFRPLRHARAGHSSRPGQGSRTREAECGELTTRSRSPPRNALDDKAPALYHRSEEHTSELQSPCNLVCRLLLEK